ncbi:hypothetical protein OSTOST_06775 [Ostertagia ostertagi]
MDLENCFPHLDFTEWTHEVAIHRQVFVFGTLRNDWEHLKSNENFVLGGPGEQVLLIIELLRTAEQAVEQIKKLATRFVLTDRLFEALVQNGKVNPSLRRDWLRKKHKFDVEADKVLEFVVRKTSDFEKIVDELCKEKRKAERRLNDSDQERRPELQKKQLLQILREEMALEAQSTTEQIRSLKERVKSQEAEIARLKGIIQTKSSKRRKGEGAEKEEKRETKPPHKTTQSSKRRKKPGPSRVQVTVDAPDGAKGGAALEQVPIEMETDEDYFEKMVQEVQEDEEMTDTEQEEEEREDSSGRIIQLCQQALELEQVLQTFPYRDFGDRKVSNTCTFCGAVDRHFSDSCPQVQDGHDRNTIVDRKKVCKCCFGNCPKDKCRFPPRDCYYCERIRGTIVEDLIPKKRHHRALCEVPDLKNEVRKRIKRLEEEIEHLRSEERFKPGGLIPLAFSFECSMVGSITAQLPECKHYGTVMEEERRKRYAENANSSNPICPIPLARRAAVYQMNHPLEILYPGGDVSRLGWDWLFWASVI